MVQIPLAINLFRAYLEASAIRRHAAQFKLYFFRRLPPAEFAEGIEPYAITFSCHFANIVAIDEFCGCAAETAVCPARPVRESKTKSPDEYKYRSSTPGKMETTLATRRRGLFGQPCDATCGRAADTKRDASEIDKFY